MASLAELTDREPQPVLSEFNTSVGNRVDDILNKLTGANGQQRYQLWPEKVIRGGLTAAGDALAGNVPQWTVDKDTGEVHTSSQMIEKAQEISALAGTGGLAGADATLGSTAFLRPALKYKDKLYKGKEGQQHQDVIPKELYPEFERMAMNGEDLTHYNFGFMNHKGQFLDREKALEYAINEGLVDAHAGQYSALTSTLMADSSKPGTAIEAMGKTANPFFSALEYNVNNISQVKMTGDQWLGTLSNKPGVKPDEMQWTGLGEFLKENAGKPVTKEQIKEHLNNNKVELKEVSKGKGELDKVVKAFENETINGIMINGEKFYSNEVMPWLLNGDLKVSKLPTNLQPLAKDILREHGNVELTKYHSYQLPGGENYREMLLMLPRNRSNEEFIKLWKDKTGVDISSYTSEQIARLKQNEHTVSDDIYKSSHWDESNILAHVRMNDRTIDGKKSLHLEEIQSDWHQQGRDKGYNDANFKKAQIEYKDLDTKSYSAKGSELEKIENRMLELQKEHGNFLMSGSDKIPDAPFKKLWHELALKRMIREAAEKGYDRLSWTPGEAQAARYDLSKQVKSIYAEKNADGSYHLNGVLNNNSGYEFGRAIAEKDLAENVGKELAAKIIKQDKGTEYSGEGLKVGGEGMKGFYDQIIPKTLEKLGKEHGIKVKQSLLNSKAKNLDEVSKDLGYGGWHFKLTPAQQEHIIAVAEGNKPNPKDMIHYIDLPKSLKDQAIQKGFPLFSAGIPIDLLDNK